MHWLSRLTFAFQAARELGAAQVGLYALYQLGLRSGYLRWRTTYINRTTRRQEKFYRLSSLFPLPSPLEISALIGIPGKESLLAEADEIVSGQVRLFGGEPVPLDLAPPGPLAYWSDYERGRQTTGSDIKFTWEPARFGWACILARAYHISQDERYALAFWQFTETFLDANPAYLGPNWISGQEVALRLIAIAFAGQVFANSPQTTPTRQARLAHSIALHAARIPPTLVYARAQNNNHLLSEAAGLFTAALLLPDHPAAARWQELGWRLFLVGLERQISEDGEYIQHSTNYHRLMLQLALWMTLLVESRSPASSQSIARFPISQYNKLAKATRWLAALVDPETGRTPNLGPNDGANLFALTICPFEDFRPVLQAAGMTFMNQQLFASGSWDEITFWFSCKGDLDGRDLPAHPRVSLTPAVLRNSARRTWAYLRAASFTSRPGHADQLHLDLWWRGWNIAQDAGTYLYNADPPWDNALASTFVHNTITINGQDQMRRAGRFLYINWAQAGIVARQRALDSSWEALKAQHNGYKRLGILHRRTVTMHQDGRWVIEDRLEPPPGSKPTNREQRVQAPRLHWLLPDWPWEFDSLPSTARVSDYPVAILLLHSPDGPVKLQVSVLGSPHATECQIALDRKGERLFGNGPVSPTWGWTSPTYGYKMPALSFSITIKGLLPLIISSEWVFPITPPNQLLAGDHPGESSPDDFSSKKNGRG